jgi:hypothetical protein
MIVTRVHTVSRVIFGRRIFPPNSSTFASALYTKKIFSSIGTSAGRRMNVAVMEK